MSRPTVGDVVKTVRDVPLFPKGTVFKVTKSRPIRADYWCYGEGYPDDDSWGVLDTDIEAWESLTRDAEPLQRGRGL